MSRGVLYVGGVSESDAWRRVESVALAMLGHPDFQLGESLLRTLAEHPEYRRPAPEVRPGDRVVLLIRVGTGL